MEKVMIEQRRWATVLFAILFLLIGGAFLCTPLLTCIIPTEAAEGDVAAFRAVAFTVAILLGLPRLLTGFELCKGSAAENAGKIIAAWNGHNTSTPAAV